MRVAVSDVKYRFSFVFSKLMKILVSGSDGFVGRAFCSEAVRRGFLVRATTRKASGSLTSKDDLVVIGDINRNTDWRHALVGCDVVVCLAARVHIMQETVTDSLAAYRSVNTEGVLNLARQAVNCGVKRFVFLSSIKVNGEQTNLGECFHSESAPAPKDYYGISKHEAEQGLLQLAADTGIEVVIIRPPLVYGPKVKGNFASLMRWLRLGVPLPLSLVTYNRRSLIALDNLVDLIITCLIHPAAANQIFLASDGEDLSTAELMNRLAAAMCKPARLFPVPPAFLSGAAQLFGKRDMAERLLGSLRVDSSHTCQTLDWKPLITVDEGLRRVVHEVSQ